jgi:hypothetical protein
MKITEKTNSLFGAGHDQRKRLAEAARVDKAARAALAGVAARGVSDPAGLSHDEIRALAGFVLGPSGAAG